MTKEEVFSLEVLEKGKRRYNQGKVKNIHMLDNMLYASVYGNDLYKVKVNLVDEVVKKMDCSCLEAQLGKRCRHEAATIIALENELNHRLKFDLNLNHREDRVKWALGKMNEEEKNELLYSYITNDTKENRHMVLFRYAFKTKEEKEEYIRNKAKDVIDSYENYYGLIDDNDEYLFEIVPQFAPIEIVFPFINEYLNEGYKKESITLVSEIFDYLLKNSEKTFAVFGEKLLNLLVDLSKYVDNQELVKFAYNQLSNSLNVAPTPKERELIIKKMVYGFNDPEFSLQKIGDIRAYLNSVPKNDLVKASEIIKVFVEDSLPAEVKASKEYEKLVDEYAFLPAFLFAKINELTSQGKNKEALLLIDNSLVKLENEFNYTFDNQTLLLKEAELNASEGFKEEAVKNIKAAFRLEPKLEILEQLKELLSKEEYQKEVLASYLDLKDTEAVRILLNEGFDGLALKIIDRKFTGKYALAFISKYINCFKTVDKSTLKEIVESKINEALNGTIAIKYADVLNYAKMVYRLDGSKDEAIKILRLWQKRFVKDEQFVELIEIEIKKLD